MKAIILCGGKGVNLGDNQEHIPKGLIKIDGKPVIHHIIRHLQFYGINKFILCVDSKGEKIKKYFDSIQDEAKSWDIKHLDTGDDANTGARIHRCKDIIGKEPFLLTYSDIIADINISQLIQVHKSKGKIITISGVHPTTPLAAIKHKNGIVTSYVLESQIETTINGGYFICEPKFLDYLNSQPTCKFEEGPLQTLIGQQQVALHDHHGFWKHFETEQDLEELRRITKTDNPTWKIN